MDDDDRGSGASSDNEQDELMDDVDDAEADPDVDMDVEAEGEAEDEEVDDNDAEDNEEDDQDDAQDQPDSPSRPQARPGRVSISNLDGNASVKEEPYINGTSAMTSNPTLVRTSASPRQASVPLLSPRWHPTPGPEALNASLYDIVPTMAAPHSTSINAITATPDMRYWFSGGSDCYVRKYDGAATINGKTLLTVAQRHPFVDSVTKAGVLMSYWENEEPHGKTPNDEPGLSPVYSLAVQREALWLLSGLESGCINLQSVRHDEGKRIAYLQKHTSAVSVLTLAADEKSVLSGSWDKNVYDWDLNTGQAKQDFKGSGGQISAIQVRPASSLPVPQESGEVPLPSGTFSSNNADKPVANGVLTNGVNGHTNGANAGNEGGEDAPGSPVDTDSLFGGDANSLFGDNDGAGAPSGGNFGDDDDEFSRAMGLGMEQQQQQIESHQDTTITDVTMPAVENSDVGPAETGQPPGEPPKRTDGVDKIAQDSSITLTNGLPHAEEANGSSQSTEVVPETQDAAATSDSTFLAASFDGVLLVWDRRQLNPVARVPTRTGGPWCMDACWSPDGNSIYAGRRNNTVEEFSLHKGLRSAERTFKFPQGSGPVSAVRAMPNGRHLICASYDILRLYDLKEPQAFKHSTVPFLIVPGPPRAGVISALYVDPTCKYMLSAAGNRGWEGSSTEVLIGYEIGVTP
ncbi:MAG: Transcription factor spt8 [Claussenomyces sp. TS43310]|nr:MAG: Transcription factor spt8 [Claussenomyces sp. TS43310]